MRDAALEQLVSRFVTAAAAAPQSFSTICHSQPSLCLRSVICLDDGLHLHNGSVLPDPLVERGGKLFKLLKLFLRLRIKERVARWRF